jgi:biotin carboxyl carrier protein
MTYEITVTDGTGKATSHRVELMRDGNGWSCRVDGEVWAVDCQQPEPEVLSLLIGGKSYEIRRDAASGELAIDARRFGIEVIDPRSLRARKAKAGSSEGPKKIKAPMPGKVVRIIAAEGTAVEAGQGVIVIEAMKMQNELKAPKAGRVATIAVAEGAAVNAGDTLAVIE